jgi:hypothetical protein
LLRRTSFWHRHETLAFFVFTALFFLPTLKTAIMPPNPFVGALKRNATWPLTEQIRAIARYTSPGDRIAIWGWMPDYYVHTATIMATRDAHTAQQINPVPYYEYFRQRYLADIQAPLPRVFVDAVAPHSYGPDDRAKQGYECFPALATLIRERYELKEEVAGVRIFALREE